MKGIFKKIGVGFWISLASAVLALAALIVYGVMIETGDGVYPQGTQAGIFFYKSYFATLTPVGVLALVFIVISLVGGLFDFEEIFAKLHFDGVLAKVFKILGKVCNFLFDAFRLVAPALLFVTLMGMITITYNGIAWSLASNEELAIDPQAVTTSYLIIVTAVLLVLSAVVGMVAAFFGLRKKEKKEKKENKEVAEETAKETVAE